MLKGQIVYIESYGPSVLQAKGAKASFDANDGWDVSLVPGYTPETIEDSEHFNTPIKPNSRLCGFKRENKNLYLTKMSCVINHIEFWKRVVAINEPMCFLEHDSICTARSPTVGFDEYLILNVDSVFRKPNALAIKQFLGYRFPNTGDKALDLPKNYPLKYYKNNEWIGSNMAPGTGAYAITPDGASKLLMVAEQYLDQSDYLINSYNVRMQYISPSPVKFNKVSLKTSHGFRA